MADAGIGIKKQKSIRIDDDRSNCCYYLFIDFDKNFVTRMLRENLFIPVTLIISIAYSFSMIFTL